MIGDFSPAICFKDSHVAFLKNLSDTITPSFAERRPRVKVCGCSSRSNVSGLRARQNRALSLFLNLKRRRVFDAA